MQIFYHLFWRATIDLNSGVGICSAVIAPLERLDAALLSVTYHFLRVWICKGRDLTHFSSISSFLHILYTLEFQLWDKWFSCKVFFARDREDRVEERGTWGQLLYRGNQSCLPVYSSSIHSLALVHKMKLDTEVFVMGLQLKSTRNKQASREREKRAAFYLKLWHDYKTATKIRKGVYKKNTSWFFSQICSFKKHNNQVV